MIHILDYDAGNLASVKRALDHLGVPSVITREGEALRRAGRIIFPGVGRAAPAMRVLRARGLDAALTGAFARGVPILGICLGCQVVLTRSEEDDTTCLGLIEGTCRRFRPADASLKVPHIGWNEIEVVRPHPVLTGVRPGDEAYFVHSYYPSPSDARGVFATCTYGIPFPAAIGLGSLFATQFHLEKSGEVGLGMLENFTRWEGEPAC